jgi:hypothetical protein
MYYLFPFGSSVTFDSDNSFDSDLLSLSFDLLFLPFLVQLYRNRLLNYL